MESIFKLGILLSVIDRVSGPSGRIGDNMDGLRGRVMALGPAFDRFKTYGLLVATVAAGMLSLMMGSAMATVETQKALGELSSVGIVNLQALEDAGTQFSGKWAGTTKAEFISAAYDIKSGIASLSDEGVAEFTKLAALTGKATKSTTAEMTKLFALGHGIFRQDFISDEAFGDQFSAAIASAVKRFRTDGADLAQGMFSIGATAKSMGVSLAEEIGIIGLAKGAFNSASEAGTSYNAFLAGAVKAQASLGLTFTDTNGKLLPMVNILELLKNKYGDLSAAEIGEISTGFGSQEATKIITALIGKTTELQSSINGLNTDMAQGTDFTSKMATAMNKDIGAGIALLAQRFHNLVEVIGNKLNPVLIPLFSWIGKIINQIIAFAKAHETLTKILVVGAGGIAAVVFVLGLLAAVTGAVGLLFPNMAAGFFLIAKGALFMKTGLLSAVASTKTWILWQRQAFLTTLYVEGGLVAYAKTLATAPFRALKNVAVATWGHITALYAQLTATVASAGGIKAFAFSMGTSLLSSIVGATGAVWSFTIALLANPITWVVLAIAAFIAAIIILEKEFGILSKAFDLFMFCLGYIAGTAVKTGKILVDAFMVPFRFFSRLIERAGGFGNALKSILKLALSIVFPPLAIAFNWEALKAGVPRMLSWIKGMIPGFLASGKALWGAFSDGIKSMIMNPVEIVTSGIAKIKSLLSFSNIIKGGAATAAASMILATPPVMPNPEINNPVSPQGSAQMQTATPPVMAIPKVPEITNPVSLGIQPEVAAPKIPGLDPIVASMTVRNIELPSIPELSASMAIPKVPKITNPVSLGIQPEVAAPKIPGIDPIVASMTVQNIELPSIPELSASMTIPKVPEITNPVPANGLAQMQVAKTVVPPAIANINQVVSKKITNNPGKIQPSLDPGKSKTRVAVNKSTVTKTEQKKEVHIHIDGLALPGVTDTNSLIAELVKMAGGYDV